MSKIQYANNTRDIQFPEIITNYPVYKKVYPSQNDYDAGLYSRFFVKKINDKIIYEISKDDYEEISENLYIKISVDWRVSGKRNDVFKDKVKIYEGVYEYNKSQIDFFKKTMIGLENVLRDPLEFWRPS